RLIALATAVGIAAVACTQDTSTGPEALTDLSISAAVSDAGDSHGRYVIVFQKKVPRKAAQIVADAGGELVGTLPEVGLGLATSSDPSFAESLRGVRAVHSVGVARFHALPETEVYVSENGPTPADVGYFNYQWDIRRVKADEAWNTTTGSHNTVVGIIDTGIAWNHPDLGPNVVYAACYSVFSACMPYPSLHWHGTHVAGTVAAAFGGGRAVGVGPDLGLASYNVFEYVPDYGVVAFDWAIWMAMLDAAAQGFDVVNMSLGGYVVKPSSQQDVAAWTAWNRIAHYVTRQGVTIVTSAGNAGVDLNGPVDHVPSDVTGVISTGATGIRPDPFYPQAGSDDVRASYSNYGAAVTLSAPGGDAGPDAVSYPWWWYLVYSDYVVADPSCAATASCPVGHAWAGGTSQAAPHVAGAAGLVKDMHPGLNPHQVIKILKQTAESLGNRQQFGHGMLDVNAAVNK
ncbi:MAG: S8 family serine peptidase, partial [Gemmatimonadota bacterium]